MRDQHRGWFKVEEEAFRKLRETYDLESRYRLAWMVYVTLCRVANLEGSDTFTRRIAGLADDAGLSYNATAEGLELVKSAGLVTITARTVGGSKERAPSEYQVVRMSPIKSATSPTEKGRLPKIQKSDLPRVSKNSPKNVSKKHNSKELSTSFLQNDVHVFEESLKANCSSEERKDFILKFNTFAVEHSRAVLPVTFCTEDLDKALDAWDENGAFVDLGKYIQQAVSAFKGPSTKRLTLVRLCYDAQGYSPDEESMPALDANDIPF